MRFFFYGTLMDHDVLSAVLGRRIPLSALKPATMRGYKRVSTAGLNYPFVIPHKNGAVKGVIMDRNTPTDCKKLMAYEDREYELVRVAVEMPGRIHAKAYAFSGKADAFFVTGEKWSLKEWQKRYKASAIAWIIRNRWRRVSS